MDDCHIWHRMCFPQLEHVLKVIFGAEQRFVWFCGEKNVKENPKIIPQNSHILWMLSQDNYPLCFLWALLLWLTQCGLDAHKFPDYFLLSLLNTQNLTKLLKIHPQLLSDTNRKSYMARSAVLLDLTLNDLKGQNQDQTTCNFGTQSPQNLGNWQIFIAEFHIWKRTSQRHHTCWGIFLV